MSWGDPVRCLLNFSTELYHIKPLVSLSVIWLLMDTFRHSWKTFFMHSMVTVQLCEKRVFRGLQRHLNRIHAASSKRHCFLWVLFFFFFFFFLLPSSWDTHLHEIPHYNMGLSDMSPAGGGDSSVVRAPDSWLKGRGFESLLERRENFLLQGRLSVLTLISVSVPPPCYRSST